MVILIIFGIVFLLLGVPIIINECYKVDSGYITVWGGCDVLGYYGTVLGSAITVISLVMTIVFTKKQIQRESYLKNEQEKLMNLKLVFSDVFDTIDPIVSLKNIMDNGFVDPSKAINILQKYQVNCRSACDRLNYHINSSDYYKFDKLINAIKDLSEEFVKISDKEVEQYSNLRLLNYRNNAFKMLEIENNSSGSFDDEQIELSNDIIEKTSHINYKDIEEQIAKLNRSFIELYERRFIALLKLSCNTFEELNNEILQNANNILKF